jgi:Ca-activated chloride channel homolog
MIWNKDLNPLLFYLITAFVVLYLIYLLRTLWIAFQLKTTARSVVLKLLLRGGYLTGIVIALLDPSLGDAQKNLEASGRDIFIVLDISKSMDATDIQPSRLEKTKFELLHLIESFPNDRIGLVVFSTEAFVQSPLTFDKDALKVFIESINTQLTEQSGTNLGAALQTVLSKYLTDGNKYNTSNLIIISDGEDFGGETIEPLLKKIKRLGMSVFVVGIGTKQGSRIPTPHGFVRDDNNEVVISKIHTDYLQGIVSITHGKYFEVSENINDFAKLHTAIEKSESRIIDRRQMNIEANKYYYFLIVALFLISIDVLISVRTIRL